VNCGLTVKNGGDPMDNGGPEIDPSNEMKVDGRIRLSF
jgi:hypothetical protein